MKRLILLMILCASIAKAGGDVGNGNDYFFEGKVDLLFVIDDSSSGIVLPAQMKSTYSHFLHQLQERRIDFRVAFITTTFYRKDLFVGQPRFLTPDTEDLEEKFLARLDPIGVGSDVERGFETTLKALQPEREFIRPEAALVLIYPTDENDSGGIEPAVFAAKINRIKPPIAGKRAWFALHYGTMPDDENHIPSGRLIFEVTTEFIELARISGGRSFSIWRNEGDFGGTWLSGLFNR